MKNENEKFYRVNSQIKFSPIIVIDQKGNNLGPIPLQKAKDMAFESSLDLVEIAPNNRPPVCRIMDFGKFKFDQTIKEKKQKKKQHKQTQIKEIRLSPSIQDNDIETKANSAIKFLKSNQKVQVKLQFKRRELMHQGLGYNVVNSFIDKLKDYGTAIGKPNSDGRNIFCTIEPKSE